MIKSWRKYSSGYFAMACGALFYLPLGSRALWDSDEGRYAEIAREMLQLKDWITPHLNYVVYLEKPPLMYWLTAVALRLFGLNAFAARFWCATFGLLTVIVTYRYGKLWRNERVGLLAGSILATSIGFFALTQYLVLDMALTFWMSLTLLALSRLLVERRILATRRWVGWAAVAIAGGILTKGPVALLLPFVTFVAAASLSGRLLQLRGIPWQRGVWVGAGLTLPWFIWVSVRQPVFPRFFFFHEHVLRYLTESHHRVAPWYFFIPVVLLGFLPWTVFLPRTAMTWVRHRGAALRQDPAGALLVMWTLVVLVFFSCSQSKLPAYILPLFPALALLVSNEFDRALSDPAADADGSSAMPPWIRSGLAALVLLFLIGACLLHWPHRSWALMSPRWNVFVTHAGFLDLLLAVGALALAVLLRKRQTVSGISGVVVLQALLLLAVASTIRVLDPYQSTERLAQRIQDEAGEQDKIVAYEIAYENVLQTLPFYLQRRVTVFGQLGELSPGVYLDPEASVWFSKEEESIQALSTMPAGTLGVTDGEHWREIQATVHSGLYRLIGRVGELFLFRKEGYDNFS